MKKVLIAAPYEGPFEKNTGIEAFLREASLKADPEKAEIRLVLPNFSGKTKKIADELIYIDNFYMDFNWKKCYVGILSYAKDGLIYYFIDNEDYFGCDQSTVDDERKTEMWAFFSKAVLSMLPSIEFEPDIIHCFDYETGMIPVYLSERFADDEYYKSIKTLMNVSDPRRSAYIPKPKAQNITGLSDLYFSDERLGRGEISDPLKGGILFADAVSLFSRDYAEKLRKPTYGGELFEVWKSVSGRTYAAKPCIDTGLYDPETDEMIAANYTVSNFRRTKPKNKSALQKALGFKADPKKFLIGVVSELTDEKGMFLIADMMNELCTDNVEFIVTGRGDEKYEGVFGYFAESRPKSTAYIKDASEEMLHRIFAGCDAVLMPSFYDGCSSVQLIAMRYGALPIVRATGVLKDTVEPYNELLQQGNGFSFVNYNAHEMLGTVRYAERIFFSHKRDWNKIVDRAMQTDYSGESAAKQLASIYELL